ncbi:MAG: hypothetical protein ABW217_16410 [Polyangiaceae bacterium]
MIRALAVCALPLLWASVALAQAPAPAQPEPLQLEWQGESSCGDAAAVRAGALELLGGTPARRRLAAKAAVQREGQGWQVRLETDSEGERGTRELRGESCAAVQRAVSLMLAMILESEPPAAAPVVPPAAEPPAPPPPPRLTPPVVDTDLVDPPQPEATPRRGPRWLLAPELSAGAGATPHLGVGIGALAAVVLGRVELGVAGRYWLAREQLAPLDDPARPGHRIGRQELEAYGCLAPFGSRTTKLALSGCVAAGATRVAGEAVRASDGGSELSHWSPSLSGGIRLRYFPISNIFAGLTPAATWSRRQDFLLAVSDADEPDTVRRLLVYRTQDVFLRISFELGLRF